MKYEQVRALIDAHYGRDHVRFDNVVQQIAASLRDPVKQDRLRRLAQSRPQQLTMLRGSDAGLVSQLEPFQFADLWLTPKLQQDVRNFLLEHRHYQALVEHGLVPRSRLLLQGEPGNGKTTLARTLATSLGCNGYSLNLSQTRGSMLGETAARMAKVYQLVEQPGTLLLLDEFDVIAAKRTNSDEGASRENNATVGSLLQLLDRPHPGIIVAATNRAEVIDPALVRRFDAVWSLEVPSPSALDEYADQIFRRHDWPIPSGYISPGSRGNSFARVEQSVMDEVRRAILAQAMEADDGNKD